MLENLTDAQIRAASKARVEALERWLRRLVDEKLREVSPAYEDYADEKGNRLFREKIRDDAVARRAKHPHRYSRFIDAVLLDDLIAIIFNNWARFSDALSEAFPEGREEARTFLKRLVDPRNKLSHANAISLREAERVICYTGDVIDALKGYYKNMGNHEEYNVLMVVHFSDSFSNSFHWNQMPDTGSGKFVPLDRDPNFYLRPGDILTLEVEIDPAFEPSEYRVTWNCLGVRPHFAADSLRLVVQLTAEHVGVQRDFRCTVISNKEWHRFPGGLDDMLDVRYRVLPPR